MGVSIRGQENPHLRELIIAAGSNCYFYAWDESIAMNTNYSSNTIRPNCFNVKFTKNVSKPRLADFYAKGYNCVIPYRDKYSITDIKNMVLLYEAWRYKKQQ